MPEPTAGQLTCGAEGCGDPAVVQWRRRLTAPELDAHAQAQETLLAWAHYEAPPGAPEPYVAPPAESTRTVYGCTGHAISLDLAALVHAADCAAPGGHCACKPEPAVPDELPQPTGLPPGWAAPIPAPPLETLP